jgi:hypothetical protein
MAVKCRDRPTFAKTKIYNSGYYARSVWQTMLLLLLIALLIAILGDKLPRESESHINATRHSIPAYSKTSTAELIPIFSGNPGGSTSFGGGTSLGGSH